MSDIERESRFALVDFYEREEVEIIATQDIVTDYDRSTLNSEEWKADTDVKVVWMDKVKKTQETHVAKILRFSSKTFDLLAFLFQCNQFHWQS